MSSTFSRGDSKWTGIAAIASVGLATLFVIRRSKARSGKCSPSTPLPPSIRWMDQDSFGVFTAMMDTILPSHDDENDLTAEKIAEAAFEIAQQAPPELSLLSVAELTKHVDHLKRGVIASRGDILAGEALQKHGAPHKLRDLHLVLKLLSTSAGSLLLTGYAVPFQQLSLESRCHVLRSFRDHRMAEIRVLFQTFKRVAGAMMVGDSNSHTGDLNPSWAAMNYDPVSTASHPKSKATAEGRVKKADQEQQNSSTEEEIDATLRGLLDYGRVFKELGGKHAGQKDFLQVDAVVVGSGAGGGVIATELVKAGLKVLILEKGGFYSTSDFKKWHQAEAMNSAFEKGGLCTTDDGNIIVLAGATVGGGSAINWSASFRLPDHVREEWVAMGLRDFKKNGLYDQSMEIVHNLVNVNTDNSYHEDEDEGDESGAHSTFAVNGNNRLMWNAAKKMGYSPEKIPRNVKGCVDCGNCCYGCPYKAKQSTLTALIEPMLLAQCSDNGKNLGCNSSCSSGVCGGGGGADTASCNSSSDSSEANGRGMLYVIADCKANKVLFANDGDHVTKKTAIGIEAEVTCYPPGTDPYRRNDGAPGVVKKQLVVQADVVVSAAGALHTPALLLRSGLKNDKIGRHLTLHPVLGVVGVFDQSLKFDHSTVGVGTGLASGVGMGVVVREPLIYAGATEPKAMHPARSATGRATTGAGAGVSISEDNDEKRHPIALETPPVHPGMLGMLLPWKSGLSFKMQMLNWSHFGSFIGISRDRSSAENRILIDSVGEPLIKYSITEQDKVSVLAGQEASLRLMRAAGAQSLSLVHETHPMYHVTGGAAAGAAAREEEEEEEKAFERYVQSVNSIGLEPNKSQAFSAHQMGSCRMSVTEKEGPVSPSGELFECNNLFVADASIFPTSLGINPMITIESIAHMISRKLLQKMGDKDNKKKAWLLASERLLAEDKLLVAQLKEKQQVAKAATQKW